MLRDRINESLAKKFKDHGGIKVTNIRTAHFCGGGNPGKCEMVEVEIPYTKTMKDDFIGQVEAHLKRNFKVGPSSHPRRLFNVRCPR